MQQGKKYDTGKLPLATVIVSQFPDAIKAIAGCSLYGHSKYELGGDWLNYKRVEPVSRYLDAMMRHLVSSGGLLSELDPESGLPHLHHAAWNLLAYIQIQEDGKKNEEA